MKGDGFVENKDVIDRGRWLCKSVFLYGFTGAEQRMYRSFVRSLAPAP